eukprot:182904-Prymnesium_polylepis.1
MGFSRCLRHATTSYAGVQDGTGQAVSRFYTLDVLSVVRIVHCASSVLQSAEAVRFGVVKRPVKSSGRSHAHTATHTNAATRELRARYRSSYGAICTWTWELGCFVRIPRCRK